MPIESQKPRPNNSIINFFSMLLLSSLSLKSRMRLAPTPVVDFFPFFVTDPVSLPSESPISTHPPLALILHSPTPRSHSPLTHPSLSFSTHPPLALILHSPTPRSHSPLTHPSLSFSTHPPLALILHSHPTPAKPLFTQSSHLSLSLPLLLLPSNLSASAIDGTIACVI